MGHAHVTIVLERFTRIRETGLCVLPHPPCQYCVCYICSLADLMYSKKEMSRIENYESDGRGRLLRLALWEEVPQKMVAIHTWWHSTGEQ